MAIFSIPAETLALAQAQQPGGASAFVGLAPLFIIVIIFYLVLFVPQQRQRKRLQQMQHELKAGDKVIMNCGIYGTIVGVEDEWPNRCAFAFPGSPLPRSRPSPRRVSAPPCR